MQPRIFMTGGAGRLGSELRALLPNVDAPEETALDITDAASLRSAICDRAPSLVLHLAAYTDVKSAEHNKALCWRVNVTGTRNVVRATQAANARLIHISTDYVFAGDRGMYREDDPVGPPANYYALSKLAAEEVARVAPRAIVIRTSFRPRAWPYPSAFTDVFTSQDYVDVIAPLIAEVILHADHIDQDVVHVATERKSVYELAKRRAPGVRPASCAEAGVNYPRDVSLDTSLFSRLRGQWSAQNGAGDNRP